MIEYLSLSWILRWTYSIYKTNCYFMPMMELILLPKLARNQNKSYVTIAIIHTERNTTKYWIIKYKGFMDTGHFKKISVLYTTYNCQIQLGKIVTVIFRPNGNISFLRRASYLKKNYSLCQKLLRVIFSTTFVLKLFSSWKLFVWFFHFSGSVFVTPDKWKLHLNWIQTFSM